MDMSRQVDGPQLGGEKGFKFHVLHRWSLYDRIKKKKEPRNLSITKENAF